MNHGQPTISQMSHLKRSISESTIEYWTTLHSRKCFSVFIAYKENQKQFEKFLCSKLSLLAAYLSYDSIRVTIHTQFAYLSLHLIFFLKILESNAATYFK